MRISHLQVVALSALTFLPSSSLKAEETKKFLESKLVAVSANTGLTDDEQHLRRLFNYSSKPGIKLTFIAKDKNIIRLDNKSFKVEGNLDWKISSYSRTSDEGDAVSFSIEKKEGFINELVDLKVEGTIDVITGTELVPKTFSLLSFDEPLPMDNFVFTLLDNKLKVEGDHKLIKEITVEHNDTVLKSNGSSWSDDYKTYTYKNIGKGAKISFSYWNNLITKTVKFSKK